MRAGKRAVTLERNLLERYQVSVLSGDIRHDPCQRKILSYLQARLDVIHAKSQWWPIWQRWAIIKGLYLYGPVGGGKTFLMDLFYQALPEANKARYHFHYFMQQIDLALRQRQGQRNPVEKIASGIAKGVKILCLDEFFVQDVTQASVLCLLLKALFKRGICLIVTSNVKPDDLYLTGVNRARFLPAIALIHHYCDSVELRSLADYRQGRDQLPMRYLTPLNTQTQAVMETTFHEVEPHATEAGDIAIQRRLIPYVRKGQRAIWFEFNVLCQVPRCQLDYLELAEQFEVFFLSHVPQMMEDETVAILLFMYVVDVLYDQGRLLILSAAVDIDHLYQAGPFLTLFERTKSRLKEMQSGGYPTHASDHFGLIPTDERERL